MAKVEKEHLQRKEILLWLKNRFVGGFVWFLRWFFVFCFFQFSKTDIELFKTMYFMLH